jgi:hypothetical protein
MNEYDTYEAEMLASGKNLDEIESGWQVEEDPFCLPVVNADYDMNHQYRPVFQVSFYRPDLEGYYIVGFYDDEKEALTQGQEWMAYHKGCDLKINAQ